MAARLQRADLVGVGHRAGVVEHQRDTEQVGAPARGGTGAEVHAGQADHLHEVGRDRARPVHRDGRALAGAGGGVGGADGDRIGLLVGVERREIVLGRRDLIWVDVIVPCDRSRDSISAVEVERGLHGGARRVGPAVVDGRSNEGENRKQGDRKDDRNISVRAEPKWRACGGNNVDGMQWTWGHQ